MVEMKSGYKMTEVGVIPEDWKVKEFNETFWGCNLNCVKACS